MWTEQAADGGWPMTPLEGDAPLPSITGQGSRALTTAVLVKAQEFYESWRWDDSAAGVERGEVADSR